MYPGNSESEHGLPFVAITDKIPFPLEVNYVIWIYYAPYSLCRAGLLMEYIDLLPLPVEIELFRALKKIFESKNKTVREKKFTIFLGDCGSQFELFAIGVSAKINSRVSDIITGCFEDIHGYETMEYGQIPYVPLIPKYRYDCGNVYEYTSETRKAGKFRKDDAVIAGLKVQYRIYESAEGIITMGRCYSK